MTTLDRDSNVNGLQRELNQQRQELHRERLKELICLMSNSKLSPCALHILVHYKLSKQP